MNNPTPTRLTIALAQTNPTVGDLAGNARAIVRAAQEAAQAGADLVLYPEMALTGYPPEDLVLVAAFRQAAWDAARQIAKDTESLPCDLIFGNLWEETSEPGEPAMSPRSGTQDRSEERAGATKNIYNASVLASGGRLSLLRAKHALPNYGVFDEMRVFAPGPSPSIVEWRGIKIGLLICEEVWQPGAGVELAKAGAEILLVQNASPYHIGKAGQRKTVVDAVVKATGLPLVYLNLVGGQDELVFDGRSYAVGADGRDVLRMPGFAEALAITSWEKKQGWQCVGGPMVETRGNEETIYHALVLGLRDYVRKNGFPGVVLGLSGGIDSALSAAIAVDALGADKVLGLRLPSPYSSQHSLDDAQALAANLGVATQTVPIDAMMQAAQASLAELFADRKADTTEENIQARLRGLVLMAASNKFDQMLLTTGNKSEMAVGYATLYGDMAGGFSVLKDVYKTTVVKLAAWRNGADLAGLGFLGAAGAVIPANSIRKPPSAELRPDQKDEDSLPPYDLLDTILRGLIERQLSVRELIAEGMDAPTVARVAGLVWAAEYKRRQSAPGVKITPMAFGRERRWPITNKWKFQ